MVCRPPPSQTGQGPRPPVWTSDILLSVAECAVHPGPLFEAVAVRYDPSAAFTVASRACLLLRFLRFVVLAHGASLCRMRPAGDRRQAPADNGRVLGCGMAS